MDLATLTGQIGGDFTREFDSNLVIGGAGAAPKCNFEVGATCALLADTKIEKRNKIRS